MLNQPAILPSTRFLSTTISCPHPLATCTTNHLPPMNGWASIARPTKEKAVLAVAVVVVVAAAVAMKKKHALTRLTAKTRPQSMMHRKWNRSMVRKRLLKTISTRKYHWSMKMWSPKKNAPRVALLATRGFEDVLRIGRQTRPELYNIFVPLARPLVDPALTFGVSERIAVMHEGRISGYLDRKDFSEHNVLMLAVGQTSQGGVAAHA
jgi:hypothetical protein